VNEDTRRHLGLVNDAPVKKGEWADLRAAERGQARVLTTSAYWESKLRDQQARRDVEVK
jgi:hypothetical protein